MGKTNSNIRLFGKIAVLLALFLCGTTVVNAQDAAGWKG